MIIHVKPIDDERDEFLFSKGFACCGELIGEVAHLAKVGGGRHGALLGVGECRAKIVGAR